MINLKLAGAIPGSGVGPGYDVKRHDPDDQLAQAHATRPNLQVPQVA